MRSGSSQVQVLTARPAPWARATSSSFTKAWCGCTATCPRSAARSTRRSASSTVPSEPGGARRRAPARGPDRSSAGGSSRSGCAGRRARPRSSSSATTPLGEPLGGVEVAVVGPVLDLDVDDGERTGTRSSAAASIGHRGRQLGPAQARRGPGRRAARRRGGRPARRRRSGARRARRRRPLGDRTRERGYRVLRIRAGCTPMSDDEHGKCHLR